MLRVKTYIGQSSIEGTGLFAGELIPKDTIIWEYNPLIDRMYTQEEFDSFLEIEKQFLTTYCYKNGGKYYLCVDNARFFNHASSEECNCYSSDFNAEVQGFTRAKRDIQPGEEITECYSNFGILKEDNDWNINI